MIESTNLDVRDNGDGTFMLLEDLRIKVPDFYPPIIVPKRFVTDFATVPFWMRWAVPKIGEYNKAVVVHDYYIKSGQKRSTADKLFCLLLNRFEVSLWRRILLCAGVKAYSFIDSLKEFFK